MEFADDAWASLLPDLLLDIFRRLETTAVLSCAGVCKPWRRAIIGNASTLRPRPDRFVPSLLLGFVPGAKIGYSWATLHRTPAPCQPMLPEMNARGCCTFVPPPTSGVSAGNLLSSRDEFLLVKRRSEIDPICLWNLVAGTCTFLPVPSFTCETYVLLTDYDDLPGSSSSDEPEVRILAVLHVRIPGGRRSFFRYQLFSATSGSGGEWGTVQRSEQFPDGISADMKPGTEVVCRGGAVHWLAWQYNCTVCTVALDVRTGRTRTTELPACWRMEASRHRLDLATSRDGRLSVIRILDQQRIQVWVLTGGDQWFLRHDVCVRDLTPDGKDPAADRVDVSVRVFCPRSGCVLVRVDSQQQVLVDVDRGSPLRIQSSLFPSCWGARPCPYEMDWSSYWTMCLTKMKRF